jgi:two-component system chemotaxis family response regulator WspR
MTAAAHDTAVTGADAPSAPSAAANGANAGDYAIRVLLVDDQLMIGEAVRRALAKEPSVEYRYCANPNDAVQAVEEFKPTVILQDLVMPGIDGLTLLRRYRETPAAQGIPVVVLSTKEEPATKSEAFSLGASDYLIKLPDTIELIARVRHHSKAYINQLQRDEAYRALHESQRKLLEINHELQRLTHVDGLTGLSNRRYFNDYSGPQWKLAIRDKAPLAILMVDVDDFKKYNDTYGHLAGDEVLKSIGGALLRSFARPTDLPARFGGEEFVVLLPATPFESLHTLGERLRTNVEELNIPHAAGVCGHVTVSIGGAATVPAGDDALLTLIEAADQALYEAKAAGKNRVMTRPK